MMKEKIIQKLIGLFNIAASIAMIIIDGDATISVFAMPLGVYFLFTKKIIIEI